VFVIETAERGSFSRVIDIDASLSKELFACFSGGIDNALSPQGHTPLPSFRGGVFMVINSLC
jgi:hypothetical protein